MTSIIVRVAYDQDARVWYVEDSNLFGLHIEGDTLDALRFNLPGAVQDLLEDNVGPITEAVLIEIIATTSVKVAA